ncbi:MAG: ATP-binding protein [Chloroflexota bacterium]
MRIAVSERGRVFGIIALASMPLLLLAAVNLWLSVGEAQERVSTERVTLARAAALTAGQSINADLRSLRLAGQTLAARYSEVSDVEGTDIGDLLDRESNLAQFVLFDAEGWVVASSDPVLPPRAFRADDRVYFSDALKFGHGLSPAALQGRISAQPTIVLATRIDFPDGSGGVLVGSLAMQRLRDDMQAHLAERGVAIVIVDAEGQMVLHPDAAVEQRLQSLRGRPDVDAALRGEAGSSVTRGTDGQELLIAYAPVPGTPWALLVQQPTVLALEAVRRDLIIGGGLLALAAGLAVVIGTNLGGRLSEAYERERVARTASEHYAEQLEHVTAENEQRRRFLERLIVSAPIPIAITKGPDHRFLSVNPRYQLLKPGTVMVGLSMAEVFPEVVSQGVLDRLDQVYRTGREYTAVDQSRLFSPSESTSEERYFTIVYAPYDDANGQTDGVLVIALETSDAVRARLQVEREKDEFLSTASHELKTPLTGLALAAQMIERVVNRPEGRGDDERLQRSVRGMIRQVHRAGDLINDLLEVSRLQRGGPSLRREPVDFRDLVTVAIERTADALPEDSGHHIAFHAVDAALTLMADESRLDQVVTNLLSNAVKYSPSAGPIDVFLVQQGGWAELRVVDHGMGVSDEERGLLFLPFSRTSEARESSIEGTGLGLYITRQIVEAHGGSITYSPTSGGGATFVVRLPFGAVNMTSSDTEAQSEGKSIPAPNSIV